jgi:hypothetical protein
MLTASETFALIQLLTKLKADPALQAATQALLDLMASDDDDARIEAGDLVRAIHPDRGWVQAEVIQAGMGEVCVTAPELDWWWCDEDSVERIEA